MKRCKFWVLFLAALLCALMAATSLAETTPAPGAEEGDPSATTPEPSGDDASAASPGTEGPDADATPDDALADETAATAGIPAPDADHPDLSASAANAAVMLREGTGGARYAHWETANAHAYNHFALKKTAVIMLQASVGVQRTLPLNRDPVVLQNCLEVPLPANDQQLEKERCYNLHAAIYASSPLASVTATLVPKDEKAKAQSVTVTFDPASDIRRWTIDEYKLTVEQDSLNDGLNFALCTAGRWTLTISATTVEHPQSVQLYTSTFEIVKVQKHRLNQNVFYDNWDEAYAFFGGDTEQFLPVYYPTNSASPQFISIEEAWRKEYLVKSELHGARVHKAALEYFNKAAEYLKTSYVLINTPKYATARPVLLDKLVGNTGTYVPRFQKNQEFISHHTLGTAVDINSKTFPNTNSPDNHEIIGTDVRDYLRYDGIGVDEKGIQYYEFTYTGDCRTYTQRIPNNIINYLIYELAFYRAGFSWGYYYETTCDAMHFMLTELDINKHIDSDVGLRKVFEYYN